MKTNKEEKQEEERRRERKEGGCSHPLRLGSSAPLRGRRRLLLLRHQRAVEFKTTTEQGITTSTVLAFHRHPEEPEASPLPRRPRADGEGRRAVGAVRKRAGAVRLHVNLHPDLAVD